MKNVVPLVALTAMFAVWGCGRSDDRENGKHITGTREDVSPNVGVFGPNAYGKQSFILCTQFEAGIPAAYGRASYTVMGKQMAQGAVIVVLAKEGLNIQGKLFPYRTVVLIDQEGGEPIPRVASPSDEVVFACPFGTSAVDILGTSYPRGRISIPESGKLPGE